MKKVTLVLAMVALTLGMNAQITKTVDTMSDKIYWTDKGIVSMDDADNAQGFRMSWNFEYDNPKEAVLDGLSLKVLGLSCLEDVTVIILFENGEKFSIKNWNKFNCKGNAWYNLTKNEKEMLMTLPINKVKVTNGRNYKSVLSTISSSNKNHFVDTALRASNKIYTIIEQ